MSKGPIKSVPGDLATRLEHYGEHLRVGESYDYITQRAGDCHRAAEALRQYAQLEALLPSALAAAFVAGVEWHEENPGDREYRADAADDYAEKAVPVANRAAPPLSQELGELVSAARAIAAEGATIQTLGDLEAALAPLAGVVVHTQAEAEDWTVEEAARGVLAEVQRAEAALFERMSGVSAEMIGDDPIFHGATRYSPVLAPLHFSPTMQPDAAGEWVPFSYAREIQERLLDPNVVHANMLRGTIAKPTIRQMLHLHGAEALARWDRAEVAEYERDALVEALNDLVPEKTASEKTAIAIGDPVRKRGGYPFPGEVRSVFQTRAGATRYVVEATGSDYAGMLHIFSPDQLAKATLKGDDNAYLPG